MARGTRHQSLLTLVAAAAATAEWTGLLGLKFENDDEVEQRTMHCPTGFITGVHVRHGRDSAEDLDMYDFKLKCGSRWGAWSGMTFKDFKEEKIFECPMKMSMTGLSVKRGRREFGDVDTYDFQLQCSGVWQGYMGLPVLSQKEEASKECPAGTFAWAWKSYRGFVDRGDKDSYEFDLNCKSAVDSREAVRKMPSLRELGLPQNVFVWSVSDVVIWLTALGLGEHGPAFTANKLQGDVIFLLLESHLQDMGMYKIGDRLYFMEELTQLHESTKAWSKALNVQLTSTRSLPDLQRVGLPIQAVSWSVKEVAAWVKALGLPEWVDAFEQHRIQGDVMFSLNEENLKEMGVTAAGDRLYIVDCLQSLYEQLTSWNKKQETVKMQVDPSRMLGGGGASAPTGYAGAYGGGAGSAQASSGAAGGAASLAANPLIQKLLAQGYSMTEILTLVQSRPELMAQLGLGRR